MLVPSSCIGGVGGLLALYGFCLPSLCGCALTTHWTLEPDDLTKPPSALTWQSLSLGGSRDTFCGWQTGSWHVAMSLTWWRFPRGYWSHPPAAPLLTVLSFLPVSGPSGRPAVYWRRLQQPRWEAERLSVCVCVGTLSNGFITSHPLSPLIQVTTWDKQLLLVGSCVHVFVSLCVCVCVCGLSLYECVLVCGFKL